MAPFQVPRSYVNYIHKLIVFGTTLQFTLIHHFCLCIISNARHIKLPFTCPPRLLQSKPRVSVHVHLQQDTTIISASQPSEVLYPLSFRALYTLMDIFLCRNVHIRCNLFVFSWYFFTRTRSCSRSLCAHKFLFLLQRVRSKDT